MGGLAQKQHGFAPLGAADGPVKQAVFGGNNARLYAVTPVQKAHLTGDGLARMRVAYDRAGGRRSNLRHGYVA